MEFGGKTLTLNQVLNYTTIDTYLTWATCILSTFSYTITLTPIFCLDSSANPTTMPDDYTFTCSSTSACPEDNLELNPDPYGYASRTCVYNVSTAAACSGGSEEANYTWFSNYPGYLSQIPAGANYNGTYGSLLYSTSPSNDNFVMDPQTGTDTALYYTGFYTCQQYMAPQLITSTPYSTCGPCQNNCQQDYYNVKSMDAICKGSKPWNGCSVSPTPTILNGDGLCDCNYAGTSNDGDKYTFSCLVNGAPSASYEMSGC